MDGYYRTQSGFARLVHKEWSALGHPFGARLLNCSSSSASASSQTTPTWLLFLDCVSQLLTIYPSHFEYSHTMLVSVWDLSLTGLTTTFTVNSLRDAATQDDREHCDAFPLHRFYSSSHCRLFVNSRYVARHLLTAIEHRNDTDTPLTPILWPPTTMPMLRVWSACYHRWLMPTHIVNGGSIVEEIAISKLCREVASLMNEITIERTSSVIWRTDRHPAIDSSTQICSGYPYTKLPESKQPSQRQHESTPIDVSELMIEDDNEYDGTLV